MLKFKNLRESKRWRDYFYTGYHGKNTLVEGEVYIIKLGK